jgi:hypothetical protein
MEPRGSRPRPAEETHVIEYAKVQRGDILRMVKPVDGLRGFGQGDLVRVTEHTVAGVMTENKHGEPCEFVFNCGAAHLEPTEWKNDFPVSAPAETEATQVEKADV